ncbi:MAG: bifunctional oligoribonuclease/PAP phosphatase NrnA, partial [Clostridiaceae bacterium]|nr:bifunctional oligoribonuclease/PAP phosphatase NrnA [Clostridiaceae bacterium]
ADSLLTAKSIVILPHINVDGDALGASVALAIALKNKNKSVDVLIEEDVPGTLDFLPGLELVNNNSLEEYDVALNIDNGDINRLGKREQYFNSARVKLSIDHHSTNKVEADISYVDTSSAATGEIVYDLIKDYLKININKDIALCLYTAIVTDTGCFRYANTTSKTLRIGSELLKFDFDFTVVIKKAYETISIAKLSLIKKTIDSLKLYENGKIAVTYLTNKDIQEYPSTYDEFEGLVNIGRNLEGVEVSIFLREEEKNHFKGSLRSNDYADVSRIAEKFNGGGHKRAAGLNIDGQLENVIMSVVEATISEIRGND